MGGIENRRFICRPQLVSDREFVEFWEGVYPDRKEELYTKNINELRSDGSLIEKSLRELFRWKFGNWLHKINEKFIEDNFIAKIGRARGLPLEISAEAFLKEFPGRKPISRIFWLHCWHPSRFPIYDMHVHRAMVFIQDGRLEELNKWSEQKIIDFYLNQYTKFFEPYGKLDLPFDQQRDGIPERKADRALWTFGKYLKDPILSQVTANWIKIK